VRIRRRARLRGPWTRLRCWLASGSELVDPRVGERECLSLAHPRHRHGSISPRCRHDDSRRRGCRQRHDAARDSADAGHDAAPRRPVVPRSAATASSEQGCPMSQPGPAGRSIAVPAFRETRDVKGLGRNHEHSQTKGHGPVGRTWSATKSLSAGSYHSAQSRFKRWRARWESNPRAPTTCPSVERDSPAVAPR
jgi:hypothetical protein